MNTKEFPTRDVLSTITGRLMGDIGGVYEVLNWMTGESVYTHQKMTIAEHERIDPLSELAEKVSPDKIIVVSP